MTLSTPPTSSRSTNVYFFEEALCPLDVNGFAELTAATSLNIATGESLTTTEEFDRFIEQYALDIVQPDAAQMGITQTFEVAHEAEQAGIMCVPHGPWTVFTVTCHTQILSVAGLEPMIEYPALVSYRGEGLVTQRATAMSNYEIVETPPELVDGHVVLPQGPGLGPRQPRAGSRGALSGADGGGGLDVLTARP